MKFRTLTPKAMARKVAMAIPKMAARMPGTTKVLHPLAVAIPHAVVGPPTLAFDATSNSFWSKRNSFPNPRITARWMAIWTRENMKMLGAVFITFNIFPVAPTTAKKYLFLGNGEKKKIRKHGIFYQVKNKDFFMHLII